MASKKKSVAISLPQALSKQLKIYQQQHNLDSSEAAIVTVLQTFFEQSDAPDRLALLEAQVDRLTEQVANLRQFIMPSIEQRPPMTNAQSIAPASSEYSYEDFEDEPDEILYDFLERGSNP